MGCKLTKDETDADDKDTTDMSSNNKNNHPSAAAIKSKIERKMCIAKDTPEPIYDLSECHLKEVPPGVFVTCKVWLKEALLLNRNDLTSLRGGQLTDLSLIRVLDLRENRLKSLPEDISELVQLRVR